MSINEYTHVGGKVVNLLDVLKAFSDETRLRIINILRHGELCVCEIEFLLGINQSNASRHLNRLTGAEILKFEKKAQWVFYSINEEALKEFPFIKEIIDTELEKVDTYVEDLERLKKHRNSGMSCEDVRKLIK